MIRCWNCGAECGGCTSLTVHRPPKNDDVCMCRKCGVLAFFDDTIPDGIRKPSPSERDQLFERLEVVEAIKIWHMTRRR